MSLSDTFENDLLKLLLVGTTITGLADNTATAPLANLYLALHTADPGEAATQATSEVNYTGYARVALARSGASWTIVGGQANLATVQSFPIGTAGSGSAAYWSLGTSAAGAGKVLWSGPVNPAIATGNGVTPQLGTGTYVALD